MTNTNRVFKAAKRTLRAEVNLIIVIIIITSWSVYALYKLALSTPDSSSFFGFSLGTKSTNQDATTNINSSQHQIINSQDQQQQLAPQQQLTLYKSQILKELLDRQRELLESQPSLNRPIEPEPPNHQVDSGGGLNFDQLKQWQGGFKLPTSLDSLLIKQGRLRSSQDNQAHLTSADSNEFPRSNLKVLRNAPSLMQLKTPKTINQRSRLNIVDYDREPEESSLDSRDYESPKEEAGDFANDDSQITTEAPPLESTTSIPSPSTTTSTTTTEEPPLSEQITNSQEATTVAPNEPTQEEPTENEQNNNEEDQEPDDESMRRVKKTLNNIDEEVDRMTQPSSGMISQHRGADYHRPKAKISYKDTVKFDDSPGNLSVPKPAIHLEDRMDKSARRKQPTEANPSDDLVTDHNRLEKKVRVADRTTTTARNDVLPALNNLILNGRARRNKRSVVDGSRPRLPVRRRQDNDGEGEDEEDEQEGENQRKGALREATHRMIPKDPSLQELLAHKQLLDALQQSRIPSPLQAPAANINGTVAKPQGSLLPARSTVQPEHQSTDTHWNVDQGLLLYPSEDEAHDYKKSSKKSMKSSKKNEKKKEHVAMKKGGHKKKKHKKEEKKYHKEKKFKGAKKGKKMKKGKGGKGGKKGSKFYKDKGFKKKGFKNIYVKNEFGQKKSYFDEFRDKDFKKKWKNFDDKYNYAQMKKWQAKEMKGAKKVKDHGEQMKKYDKSKWKKKYLALKKSHEAKKKKKMDEFR